MTAKSVTIRVAPRGWTCTCHHRLRGFKSTADVIRSADAHAAWHTKQGYDLVTVELGAVAKLPAAPVLYGSNAGEGGSVVRSSSPDPDDRPINKAQR